MINKLLQEGKKILVSISNNKQKIAMVTIYLMIKIDINFRKVHILVIIKVYYYKLY